MTIQVKMTGSKNAAYYSVCENDVVEMELEEYLVGVVAAEIGNASLEACKAQAVASRTMVYPYYSAGKIVSDSSKSIQCFNALRAHSDKYPLAVQAVEETAGEVLSYDGKVIVPCSFSADNGGRTVSSEERWGGKRAWLIAQEDPWDKAATGGKKTGHGVGMSQAGARYAAGLGKGYADILSFYYPGTKIFKEGEKMDVQASELVEKFKTMVLPWCSPNSPWKYVAGGASKGAVDCSGAFTYWYKQLGGSMYHGSNTMWRKYTTAKGKIGEIDLVPGMAVFKMRQDGKEPSSYKEDGEGNFYHVGLYIGNGLVIEAQSVSTGCITSKLFTWKYAAKLTGTVYDMKEVDGESVASTATVVTGGGSLNMRKGAGKSYSIITRIPNGASVTVVSREGDWVSILYNGKSGYVLGQYLSFGDTVYTLTGTTTSETAKNQIVEFAEGLGVTLTVTGGED